MIEYHDVRDAEQVEMIARLRALLREIEWFDYGDSQGLYCLFCRAAQTYDQKDQKIAIHAPDCRLKAALEV